MKESLASSSSVGVGCCWLYLYVYAHCYSFRQQQLHEMRNLQLFWLRSSATRTIPYNMICMIVPGMPYQTCVCPPYSSIHLSYHMYKYIVDSIHMIRVEYYDALPIIYHTSTNTYNLHLRAVGGSWRCRGVMLRAGGGKSRGTIFLDSHSLIANFYE